MSQHDSIHLPLTHEHYRHVRGPFHHGTRTAFVAGDELVPGTRLELPAGPGVEQRPLHRTSGDDRVGAELATARRSQE